MRNYKKPQDKSIFISNKIKTNAEFVLKQYPETLCWLCSNVKEGIFPRSSTA